MAFAQRSALGRPRHWLLALVILLIVAGATAAVWFYDTGVTPEMLEAWIASLGVWAPIGFVLLYGVATVAMIPGGVFDLVGGAVFGPYLGTLLDLAGGSLGAALAFLVARYIARDWLETRAGARLQSVMRSVHEEGWRFVAFVRLVPIFPYNIVNYLLGLTRIPFLRYVIATIVFMAPSTVAYTWLGFAGRQVMAGDNHEVRYALVALALLGVLIFVPRFVFRRIKRANSKTASMQ
jgi:uncharacterized membrane protein YdjX (TVP38/TMEM64 family)